MGITDQKYKNIHDFQAVVMCWAEAVAQRYGLGRVDQDSLVPLPTSSTSDRYQERIGDGAWRFDTEVGPGVLVLTEVQAERDFMAPVRFCQYLCNQLLLEHKAKPFGPDRLLPLTVMVSLYTGSSPWALADLSQLFAPYVPRGSESPLQVWHFDMKHMDADAVPVSDPVRLLFDVERYRKVSDIDVPALVQRLDALQDGDLKDRLLAFISLTLHDFDPRLLLQTPQTTQELGEMVEAYRITHADELRMTAAQTAAQTAIQTAAQTTARIRLEDCLEVLLACGTDPSAALELGLDLLVMDDFPALGLLVHTQGDLVLLRTHIPPQPREGVTADDRRYVKKLLQGCHSYPSEEHLELG